MSRRTVATVINEQANMNLAAELLGHTDPKVTVEPTSAATSTNPLTAELLEAAFAPDNLMSGLETPTVGRRDCLALVPDRPAGGGPGHQSARRSGREPSDRLHKHRSSYTIVFMANVSVAEAARRLGVGVPRIHQRIADGSLRAQRIGSQWVVDELSLLRVAERREPGRPLSARSAWAIIALAEGNEDALAALAPVERSRAKARLEDLLALVAEPQRAEDDVRRIASALRLLFHNRAERELRKAVVADLPKLREDPRWQSLMSPAVSGIASSDIDGYLAASDVQPISREFLLMPADADANVVIHVLPEEQKAYPESSLQLAADLAEQRGPREELRAAELLREVAEEREAVK